MPTYYGIIRAGDKSIIIAGDDLEALKSDLIADLFQRCRAFDLFGVDPLPTTFEILERCRRCNGQGTHMRFYQLERVGGVELITANSRMLPERCPECDGAGRVKLV